MKNKSHVFAISLLVMIAALALSILLAVTIGSTSISMPDVYGVIANKLFGVRPELSKGSVHDVVWLIRLPRLVLAVGVGAALSVSGTIMQAVVRNPMADPYILGISSGSYLGAVLAMLLGIGAAFGSKAVGTMAFFGAFGMSLAVVALSNIGGRSNTVKLLLTGTALSSVCSSFSSFIVYRTNDSSRVQAVTYWLMGSFGSAKWEIIAFVLPVVFVCVVFFCSQFRSLNLMLVGDEAATTLGVNLRNRRLLYLIVSALMVGFSVFSAGMIGFVGLVIPHAARMLFGSDNGKVVPVSAVIGAIFLVWMDVLCRIVIKGAELPVGILTSMVGAPCFVYLMVRRKYSFGGEQ